MRWGVLLFCGWVAATVSGAAGFGGALLLLPVLTLTIGAKAAVPVLAVSQLMGNVSRAAFGWREIRWRPALLFSAGAVPASVIGARLFVGLPPGLILRLIGLCLLIIVIVRHTPVGQMKVPERALAPAGALVGLISSVVGSAGPLGAAVFLGLRLPATAYVASEAVAAALIHLTKCLVYGRYALLGSRDLAHGLALGSSLVLGSWTGRKLVRRLSEKTFAVLVELLLVVSALTLLA